MNNTNYPQFVTALCKEGSQIKEQLTSFDAHVLHMAVGVSSDSGELLDAIKKGAIYKKEYDIRNIIEEMGDIEFFLEGLRQAFGLKRDLIIDSNIEKLSKRYQSLTYSNQAAQERKDKQ